MQEIIRKLQSKKIRSYLQSRHVDHIRLVGSFSRGEENDDSDIDLLFKFKNSPALDRSIYTLADDMQGYLGRTVDMLDIDYLNRHIAPGILADKIAIW